MRSLKILKILIALSPASLAGAQNLTDASQSLVYSSQQLQDYATQYVAGSNAAADVASTSASTCSSKDPGSCKLAALATEAANLLTQSAQRISSLSQQAQNGYAAITDSGGSLPTEVVPGLVSTASPSNLLSASATNSSQTALAPQGLASRLSQSGIGLAANGDVTTPDGSTFSSASLYKGLQDTSSLPPSTQQALQGFQSVLGLGADSSIPSVGSNHGNALSKSTAEGTPLQDSTGTAGDLSLEAAPGDRTPDARSSSRSGSRTQSLPRRTSIGREVASIDRQEDGAHTANRAKSELNFFEIRPLSSDDNFSQVNKAFDYYNATFGLCYAFPCP